MNEHGPGSLGEDEQRPLTGVRALVVEDDVDTLELWTEVLTDAGATAMGATSAEAAFRAFQLRPPDVLIADVALVDNDGYWLIQRVRELPEHRGGQVPAIAISGQVAGHPQEGRGAGFHAYAVKPVDPYQLIELVRTLVGQSRG